MTVGDREGQTAFSLKQKMFTAVFAGCAIIFFQVLLQLMPEQESYSRMLGLLGGMALGIAVHELGHVAGALIARFSIFSFAIGPITVRRESSGLRLRIANLRVGGMITAVPLHSNDLRQRMLVLTAAGPAGSLIGGGLEYFLGRAFQGYSWSTWMFPLALICWVLGVISLLPMRRFYVSDGARLLELLRNTQEADRICSLLAIAASALAGKRPREWDPTLIQKALWFRNGSGDDVIAVIMAYESEMDLHHFDAAETYLQSAIAKRSQCPSNLKSAIAADAAFFHAAVRNDAGIAREWLEQCHARDIEDGYVIPMIKAAVLIAEGRGDEADAELATSIALLRKARFPGFALAAQDWITIMNERIQAQKDGATARPTVG